MYQASQITLDLVLVLVGLKIFWHARALGAWWVSTPPSPLHWRLWPAAFYPSLFRAFGIALIAIELFNLWIRLYGLH